MNASSIYDFDKDKGDRGLKVDLVISDLRDLVEGEKSHKRFGSKRHELFRGQVPPEGPTDA